ncbi:ADP-ribose pyrophosphatase YjhB (NUDIX family) [Streptosporangium becharense]|uniref:ADP-ribose pyrophosphatase YjhB (NUDIX family) n=1 Tax=Streptosporangium becharense TaxID=1816182 RepID=A0A7W9MHL4_9ACTN|nr:NUDIX domain-containing protein [Streptosporangium becharense]MBB2912582.1 ADP-ribose pyrophosphatase YjhB (NUDIX family) [Streptosporangium becharense]MBB5820588.1 ADP-ribose pyrophosphatase YjhB (NUDIX family) [Streptosporangium becharense]
MPEVITRPSARILLVDDQDRLLLYRGLGLMKNSDHAWFTPGGGVNDGELLKHAAARELREETGHSIPPEELGHVVATSSGHWRRADGQWFLSVDSFFFLRGGELKVDVSGMEDLERSLIDRFHWWSLPELRSTDERIIPLGLTGLLERLLDDDIPSEPVIFPWHHPDPFS